MSQYPGSQPPSDPYYGQPPGGDPYAPPPSDPYFGQQPGDPYAQQQQQVQAEQWQAQADAWAQQQAWWAQQQSAQRQQVQSRERRGGTGAAIVGIFMVLLGVWFLFRDEIAIDIGTVWPVVAVALGIVMVIAAFIPRRV
jgi:uncharacterized membrane protein